MPQTYVTPCVNCTEKMKGRKGTDQEKKKKAFYLGSDLSFGQQGARWGWKAGRSGVYPASDPASTV